jgi:hypothetical protein
VRSLQALASQQSYIIIKIVEASYHLGVLTMVSPPMTEQANFFSLSVSDNANQPLFSALNNGLVYQYSSPSLSQFPCLRKFNFISPTGIHYYVLDFRGRQRFSPSI